VVVATGARWATDGLNFATHEPIPGAEASLPHVLTPEQVMLEGKTPPGERVLVLDADGYFMGAGIAEKLLGDGFSVEIVTPHDRVAPVCDETLEGTLLRQHLHDVGIGQRPGATVAAVEPGRVTATDQFGEPLELEADAVVLVTQRLSDDSLYLELKADGDALVDVGIEALYRIGDCVAPRIIAEAIFDGHRLAREIDSENPTLPLPYRRERLVLESVPTA
jgi:dimethylamine/trimethylamine dehydrogenase